MRHLHEGLGERLLPVVVRSRSADLTDKRRDLSLFVAVEASANAMVQHLGGGGALERWAGSVRGMAESPCVATA